MGHRVLIVEDEERLSGLLADYLIKSGFDTHIIGNGLDVVPYVRSHPPDIILLDLMLPGRDGLDIARELRTFSQTPLIMITARVEEIDRLLGLELGADDYVCKPFSFREVVARVKAVLRRTKQDALGDPPNGVILDKSKYKAVILGNALELTAIEFNLLEAMAMSPGRIFTRDILMDVIYPDGRVVSDRTIDSHISKLRRKIQDLIPDKEIIVSVYSVGYKFEVPEV
ncbi:MAG: response regulator [Desulfobacteraceae bacterium]|jgi:two-component system response regulator BaeR